MVPQKQKWLTPTKIYSLAAKRLRGMLKQKRCLPAQMVAVPKESLTLKTQGFK